MGLLGKKEPKQPKPPKEKKTLFGGKKKEEASKPENANSSDSENTGAPV